MNAFKILKYSISINNLIADMLPNEILLAYLAALSAIIDLISGEHYKRPIEYDPNPCGDVVLSSNGSSLTWHESIEGVCCNCPRFMRIAELCT